MRLLELLLVLNIIFIVVECKNRVTFYASIGSNAQLTCQSGGSYVCFSTYTFENTTHPMIILNTTSKYTVGMNSITINNVDATDAGFYACSSNCNQMNSAQMDFYLVPMNSGQQPIDTSQNFIPIPPFYGYGMNYIDVNNLFVPIAPNIIAMSTKRVLNGGEIAGIVIGCVVFVLILATLITILFIFRNRKPKSQNTGKNKTEMPPDDPTDSKHDTLKSDKNLINSGRDDVDESHVKPKSGRQRVPSHDDVTDLPNIDILTASQRSNRQPEIDPQIIKNYQIADRIANKFAQEEELRQQQQQQQQPKQLTARFDSYNNSFSAGLDGPQQQQQQQQAPMPRSNNSSTNNIPNANLYSISTGNGNGNGNVNRTPVKKPSFDQQASIDLQQPKNLPPNRAKIEFPKQQQQQQPPPDLPLPQQNRKFSNRSQEVSDPNFGSDYSRNESDDDYARRGKKRAQRGYYGPIPNNDQFYDLSDEDRRKLSNQTSEENQSSSQQPPSFKSLLKQQKQQGKGINDLLTQPVPTSRSYQGTTTYQMQIPKQNQVVYDKRSESTHVDRNYKDNTTDV